MASEFKGLSNEEKTPKYFDLISEYVNEHNIPFEKVFYFFAELAVRLHVEIEDKVNPHLHSYKDIAVLLDSMNSKSKVLKE